MTQLTTRLVNSVKGCCGPSFLDFFFNFPGFGPCLFSISLRIVECQGAKGN